MKFVALLSGGKDSCYNIMRCIAHSHELIAVANLTPTCSSTDLHVEEMNSYMYQSAAHNMIPALAECLGVPLMRQTTAGKAEILTLDYDDQYLQGRVDRERHVIVGVGGGDSRECGRGGDGSKDEVEDMYLLLKRVKEQFPDVQGVSCGAIVSSYQRYRVESVCRRLALTPLTYLWQMDRHQLLDDMISSGIRAVLVKVAGAGLDPDKHLGKELSQLRPVLLRLHDTLGLDVCGEGGYTCMHSCIRRKF